MPLPYQSKRHGKATIYYSNKYLTVGEVDQILSQSMHQLN
jgi:hypothetical protein